MAVASSAASPAIAHTLSTELARAEGMHSGIIRPSTESPSYAAMALLGEHHQWQTRPQAASTVAKP
jgi:hypothetical protein